MGKSLYIDIETGEARTSLNGSVTQRLKLFLRDITPLRIAFYRGPTNVTADILDQEWVLPAILKVGIRARAGQGDILALAQIYEVVDGMAAITLNLNTVALVDFMDALPATQESAELVLEVEVSSNDSSTIVTYFQAPCIIGKEVNISDDDPPVPAAEADNYVLRSEVAAIAGATYLDELLDVEAPTPASQEFLAWNQAQQRWTPTPTLDGGNF